MENGAPHLFKAKPISRQELCKETGKSKVTRTFLRCIRKITTQVSRPAPVKYNTAIPAEFLGETTFCTDATKICDFH